jgi:phosphoglycerate dehydrogenase-like enzyme
VDFDALTEAARQKHVRVAIDVFPVEPVTLDDPVRSLPNAILSPHRAAAVEGGRHLIGKMLADDVIAMIEGRSERRLQQARPVFVEHAVGAYRTQPKQ